MYGYNFAEKPEVAKRYPHHLLCEGLPHLSSNKIIKVLNGTKPLLNAHRQDGFVAYNPGGFAGTSKYIRKSNFGSLIIPVKYCCKTKHVCKKNNITSKYLFSFRVQVI